MCLVVKYDRLKIKASERVPKRLIPNKNALLIGLGQTLSKNAETKPEAQNNELSAIIELIK